MTSSVPAWATQVPSAPVQQPVGKAYQISMPDANTLQAMGQQLLQSIVQGFMQVLDGFVLPGVQPTTQLASWNSAISAAAAQFQQLITQITNNVDGDVNDLIAALQATATDASTAAALWTTVLTDLGLPSATASGFVSWLQTLLTPNSSLNASNLWGLLPSTVGLQVPSTAVTADAAQPLWNPDFQDAISLSPGSGVVWDSTVYYPPAAGAVGSPGSALFTADATLHAARSNPIKVSGGQTVAVTAQVLTSGLVCTGSPIQLDIITYLGNTQVAVVQVAAMGVPVGASTAWVNPPGGAAAGTLTGTPYVVPNDGTVDGLLVRPVVDTSATAGTVRFGGFSVAITGGLIANIQSDTSNIVASFAPGGTSAEFLAGVTGFLSLFNLTPASVGGATSITAFWTAIVTGIINPLNALEVQAENIVGQIELAAINGLTSTLNQLLPTSTYQFLVDALANGLGHSGTGHTWANIESYLGIIPPTNVGPVLSGATLADDVNAVHGAATANTTNIGNMLGWLYGTTTPPDSPQVQAVAVQGTQGIPDIATTIQNTWDSLANAVAPALGLTHVAASDNALSTLTGAMSAHAQATQTALTQATSAINAIDLLSSSAPLESGYIGPIFASNMSLFDVNSNSNNASVYPFGSSTSYHANGAYLFFPAATTIGSVVFCACYSTTSPNVAPTGFYVNIYSLNLSTGTHTLLTTSPNLVSRLTVGSSNSASAWVDWALATPLSVAADTVLLFDFVGVTNSSSSCNISMVGATSFAPTSTAVYPSGLGASRGGTTNVSPASLTAGGVTPTNSVPYVGVGGPTTTPFIAPVTNYYPSTQSVVPPAWANHVDVIAWGGGGGGGGGVPNPGSPGSNTTVTVGGSTLTAAGAAGGISGNGLGNQVYGQAAGAGNFDTAYYQGGGTVSATQAGASPGGGGGAGQFGSTYGYGGSGAAMTTGTYPLAGVASIGITIGAGGVSSPYYGAAAGAPGGVYLRFYQ